MTKVNNFDFVCVSGYGKSGSGACLNLLKEFEYIDGLDNEFRIAKDPSGLIDLEEALVSNWEFVRHNTAINDFLAYCEMLERNDGLIKKVGKGFSKKLYVDFLGESNKYIDNLTNFRYFGDTLLHRYKLSAIQAFLKRLRSRLGFSNEKEMYFAKPTSELFLLETNKYINKLYEKYANKNNLKKVLLNQSIPPNNISKAIKYFSSKKMIIVDRDPRDIYATMNKEKRLLGSDKVYSESVDKYIFWHKAVREKLDSQNEKSIDYDILELKFEDFFTNYENVIKQLTDFLEIDFLHKDKGMKFNPLSIERHVGIWKNEKNQKLMNKIYQEFPDSCFNNS